MIFIQLFQFFYGCCISFPPSYFQPVYICAFKACLLQTPCSQTLLLFCLVCQSLPLVRLLNPFAFGVIIDMVEFICSFTLFSMYLMSFYFFIPYLLISFALSEHFLMLISLTTFTIYYLGFFFLLIVLGLQYTSYQNVFQIQTNLIQVKLQKW